LRVVQRLATGGLVSCWCGEGKRGYLLGFSRASGCGVFVVTRPLARVGGRTGALAKADSIGGPGPRRLSRRRLCG